MCISYIPYVVHWSMRLSCTGGLNIVHVELKYRKWQKMAKNAHAHGGAKSSTCMTRIGLCRRIGAKWYVSN